MNTSVRILPTIVLSQFLCTSLWFASNGVMDDLISSFQLDNRALGYLTSSVQLGFISGTLIFAVFTIVDRYSPSKVFFISAVLGALFNLGVIWNGNGLETLLVLRFMTGFFLAGIYPVGMKIASDYYDKGLGISLSYLVGALVLGTAIPHLLHELSSTHNWQYVIFISSLFAVAGGGLMMYRVADGPYCKPSKGIDLSAVNHVFRSRKFRSAAFGYFGHMWELYAFWTFVPLMLQRYSDIHSGLSLNMSLWSFVIIGIGGLGCVVGGYIAQKVGEMKIAKMALLLSGLCCLVSPLMFLVEVEILFIAFLLFWGMVVIADSPLFSTLVAQNAAPHLKGTALTIVTCIGFMITIVSIQLIDALRVWASFEWVYMVLAVGPILGLLALLSDASRSRT